MARNATRAVVDRFTVARLPTTFIPFYTNRQVKSLRIYDNNHLDGAMIGNVLLKDQAITKLALDGCTVDTVFLQAMVLGLLASRGRLQSLRLDSCGIDNQILEA
jgi:hypothetical protein